MVIKKTLVTPFCGDQKNLVALKVGSVICFWKTLTPWQGLSKNIWHSPFPNNRKNSVAISQWGVSNGNRIFSVTIQHTRTIKWWLNLFDHQEGIGGMNYFFQKWYYMRPRCPHFNDQKILVIVQHAPTIQWWPKGMGHVLLFWGKKIIPYFTSWVTKELRSPSNGVSMLDGNWIFSIAIWYTLNVWWRPNYFGHPKRHGREGHEMTIKIRERGENEEKEDNENKGKLLARLSKRRKERARKRKRENWGWEQKKKGKT